MRFTRIPLSIERIVKRFALLPVIIGEEIRWLEIVSVKQMRVKDSKRRKWRNIQFID